MFGIKFICTCAVAADALYDSKKPVVVEFKLLVDVSRRSAAPLAGWLASAFSCPFTSGFRVKTPAALCCVLLLLLLSVLLRKKERKKKDSLTMYGPVGRVHTVGAIKNRLCGTEWMILNQSLTIWLAHFPQWTVDGSRMNHDPVI